MIYSVAIAFALGGQWAVRAALSTIDDLNIVEIFPIEQSDNLADPVIFGCLVAQFLLLAWAISIERFNALEIAFAVAVFLWAMLQALVNFLLVACFYGGCV